MTTAQETSMTKHELIEAAAVHIRDQLREGVPHIKLIQGMASTHFWLDGDDVAAAFRRAGELLPEKGDLLAHYADRDPKRFVQLDGWTDADGCMGRDAEGYGITGLLTTELMHGSDVRVLIPLGADPADTVMLLRRAIHWIEKGAIEEISNVKEPTPQAVSEWSIPF